MSSDIGIQYQNCEFGATSLDQCKKDGNILYVVHYRNSLGESIEFSYSETKPERTGMDMLIKNNNPKTMTHAKIGDTKTKVKISCVYKECSEINLSSCLTKPTNSDCYEQ